MTLPLNPHKAEPDEKALLAQGRGFRTWEGVLQGFSFPLPVGPSSPEEFGAARVLFLHGPNEMETGQSRDKEELGIISWDSIL